MASPETLQINVINATWAGASGAATDIDEPIGSPDTAYYGPGPENDAADFGFGASEVVDADVVTNISFNMIYRDDGTAGNLFVDVELLIGGVSQGTTQIAVTGSDTTYSDINNAGWNVDRTAAEMDGMELRLTPVNTGMPGTNAGFLETANAIVTFTSPTFIPEAEEYGFHKDGTESGAAFIEVPRGFGIMLNHTLVGDQQFQFRPRIQETGGLAGATSDDWRVEYEKNGAGGWVVITTTSALIQVDTASSLSDGGATTDRLPAGTGSFDAGEQEDGNGVIEDYQLPANDYTNLLWAFKPIEADISSGDYVKLRVTLNGSPITNSLTPAIFFSTGAIIRSWVTGRDSTPNNTFVADRPPGLVDGDLWVVLGGIDEGNGGSGWDANPLSFNTINDLDVRTIISGCWQKIASSEPATVTFTATGVSADDGWHSIRIDGHDPTTPIDVSSENDNLGTTVTALDITPTVSPTLILATGFFNGSDHGFDADKGDPPTGSLFYINGGRCSVGNVSSGTVDMLWGFSVKPTAAATGAASWTTAVGREWHAYHIAIAPPAPPGGATPYYYNQVTELQGNE